MKSRVGMLGRLEVEYVSNPFSHHGVPLSLPKTQLKRESPAYADASRIYVTS